MIMLLISILLLYAIGNVYVFIRAAEALASYPIRVRILLSISYWLCAVSIFVVFALSRSLLNKGQLSFVYEIGSGWLVFILYMTIALLVFDVVRLVYKPVPFSFHIACALTLSVLGYGYYNYLNPKVRTLDLTINKELSIPSLKVVGFSDVHLGIGTGNDKLQKYIEMVNAQNPDLIIISGDLIDNNVAPLYANDMDKLLAKFNAPMGIYMAPGNHEYISGIDESIEFLKKTPIQLLSDTVVMLPNGIQIVGRDDRRIENRSSLQDLMKTVDPSKPIILIDHQPYNLDETAEAGIDLQLSGHTHRGQIWPMNWIVDNLFEVSFGYEKRKESHIYVSTGLSLWGPPFRIGTDSEIVVFNITFGNNN